MGVEVDAVQGNAAKQAGSTAAAPLHPVRYPTLPFQQNAAPEHCQDRSRLGLQWVTDSKGSHEAGPYCHQNAGGALALALAHPLVRLSSQLKGVGWRGSGGWDWREGCALEMGRTRIWCCASSRQ